MRDQESFSGAGVTTKPLHPQCRCVTWEQLAGGSRHSQRGESREGTGVSDIACRARGLSAEASLQGAKTLKEAET